MDFAHSLDKAGGLAAKALRLMQEKGIAPHPNNFTVWYSYCSGEFPQLNDALDLLLDNRQTFDEARNAEVFRRFCAGPGDAVPVHLIAEKVEAELGALLAAVEGAASNSADFGDTLERARDMALAVNHPQAFRHLIAAIVERTRTVTRQTRELETRLVQSAKEIADLRAQLEGVKREAMIDPLTGLANRRMFARVLREAALAATDEAAPLSLLLLDIDHFRRFNESYGRAAGDQVLKLLAATLADAITGGDRACRYGGEEFAIVLPDTCLAAAADLAESLRRRIAGKTVVDRRTGGALGRVHVSVGVAQLRPGEPLRTLVERADKALYFAKRSGRNRVIADGEGDPASA